MATLDIIDANLELMLSLKKCGMMGLLRLESVGARGHFEIGGKKYQLMGANFYYDGETGQIFCFSNRRETFVSKARGQFKVVADFKKDQPYFRIIEFTPDENASKQAKRVIKNCIKLYNDTYESVKE